MNEIIRKRKSVRKYETTALDDDTLSKVRAKIETLKPLYEDIDYSVDIVEKTKGLFNIKAPHYLVFGGEKSMESYENIGFIGQQMDLFFSENGIGACWLGVSKPEENRVKALPCIVSMSFGKPAELLHRTQADFKRKPISDISEGSDPRLEAARLAPSGMNRQNWFFIAENGEIHCYLKKASPLLETMLRRMAGIDLGIAICHIAQESENFQFKKKSDAPSRKGHHYVGTVH